MLVNAINFFAIFSLQKMSQVEEEGEFLLYIHYSFHSFPFFTSEPGLPDGFIFKPKIPFWVNFGGSCNGR
jgi:hypothetical protein